MADGSFPEWLYIIANAVQAAGHERLAQDLRGEHILGTNGVWEPDVAALIVKALTQAASELSRLQAENEGLRKALEEAGGVDLLRMELEDALDDERPALIAEIQRIQRQTEAALAPNGEVGG